MSKGNFPTQPIILLRRLARKLKSAAYSIGATTGAVHDPYQSLRELAATGKVWELAKQAQAQLLERPKDAEIMALLGYAFQQQGRLEEAALVGTQAASLSPDLWLPHFVAGVSLKALGRPEQAYDLLRRASLLAPADEQTARTLVEVAAAVDGIAVAAEHYDSYTRRLGRSNNSRIATVMAAPDWARVTGARMLDLGEPEVIPFEDPHVWGQSRTPSRATVLGNRPYVVEIKNARVLGNSSLILTDDGTLLNDSAGHPVYGRAVRLAYETPVLAQQADQVLFEWNESGTEWLEEGALLSGLASNAYGHWLPEFLPKLQYFRQHPDFAGIPLVVDADMPASHFEYLRLLSTNPLVRLKAGQALRCRRLLVAPSPAFFPVELFPNEFPVHELGALSPRSLRVIRDGVLGQVNSMPAPGNRRIFLGRKKLKWRCLLNEDEISSDLANLGFETIYVEELSLPEQIELFRSAAWIVAPNGSALLNLIFSDPRVNLLVLSHANLFNWGSFQGPMQALGYRPVFLCAEDVHVLNQKHADYAIPPSLLRQALFDMGLSR